MFFLMQNIFIVPAMKNLYRYKVMVDVGLACNLYKTSKQKTTSRFMLYNTRPEAWSIFTPGVILQLQAGDQGFFDCYNNS